ncbi:MAG: DMT family transporter [Bdellovibrionaceae bacterium]|nr:DMT family transporter [Pseudobdellovibrionaceae bacterium]
MRTHRKGLLEVGFASLCFGLIGLFGKEAFQAGLSIGQLLTIRFGLAALVLGFFLFVLKRNELVLPKKEFLISAGLGVFGYTVFASLYFVAIDGVSIALAALLLYTYPFWTVLFNAVLGERLRKEQWFGLAGASAGLIFLLWGQIEVQSLWAIGAGILSAITYSLFVIISGRTLREVSSAGSGFWIILFATIGLALLHRPDFSAMPSWSASTWGIIFAIALIGTVIPLVLIQSGLQKLTSTQTALLCMLEPVMAALAGMIWLGEALSLRQILGAVLVLGSLWLTQRSHSSTLAPPAGSTEA